MREAQETYFRLSRDPCATPEEVRLADLRMWAAFGARIDEEAQEVRPWRLSTKKARERLQKVARHAEALRGALDALPPQLRALIDSGEIWEERLARLGLLAGMANAAADGEGLASARDGRGRPAKHEALAVAAWAARDFEARTGRRAAITVDPATNEARGEFLLFVAQVFDELGISASQEAAARAAIDALKLKEENRAARER